VSRSSGVLRRLAAVGTLWLAAIGCGPPTEGAEAVPSEEVPAWMSEAPVGSTAATPNDEAAVVYLVADERLVAVPRQLPTPRSAVATVAELLEGPTGTEASLGVTTALPDDAIGSIREGGGVVQLEVVGDLDAEVADPGLAFAQLVLTLTEADPELSVAFSRDGAPLAVPLPDGTRQDGSVGREAFLSLLAD